jgi:hypothetical protein
MSGLTNGQLEKMAKKMLKNKFLGVYPADANPSITKTNTKNQDFSLIFNLSKHDQPGSHYVAILIKHNAIYYFDSYGRKLTNRYIKKFLKTFSKPIYYHTKKIQHQKSIFCGIFTLAYLKIIQKENQSFSSFFKFFDNPATLNNDNVATNLIIKK